MLFIDHRIESPRTLLEAEIERIFTHQPLDSDHVEFILNSYSEPWRAYHNCEHILRTLDLLKQLQPQVGGEYVRALEIMAVYHDVVYKLRREKGWNERESAIIAGKQLVAAGYKGIFVELVVAGIECTIEHTVPESLSNWAKFIWPLIDADLLAGFGTSWKEFSEKTRLIGLEYAPLFTTDEYRASRAEFAKTFLLRPKIFHDPVLSEYEFLVRENLTRMTML